MTPIILKKFILFFSICLLSVSSAYGQEKNYSSYKIGFEPSFIYYWLNGFNNSFGLKFEKEKSWRNIKILSNNYSLGWLNRKNGTYIIVKGQRIKLNSIVQNIYFIKYTLNVYPFGNFFKSNQLQGFYIGLGPGAYFETRNRERYREGLGLFLISGLQFIVTGRLILSTEIEMFATTDFNNTPTTNPDGNYLINNTITFKVGWIFKKRQKER